MIPLLAIEISRPYLVSVVEQASLHLTWSQTPKTGFLMTRLIYPGHVEEEAGYQFPPIKRAGVKKMTFQYR